MATRIIIVCTVGIVVFAAHTAFAQAVLLSHVIGSGGGVEASSAPADISLSATIGQVVNSTPAASASLQLFEGFWVPWQYEVVSVEPREEAAGRLRVFPNPFSDRATLTIPGIVVGEYSVVLYNMAGELVHRMQSSKVSGSEVTLSIEAHDDQGAMLSAGLYIVEVQGALISGIRVRMHHIIHVIH